MRKAIAITAAAIAVLIGGVVAMAAWSGGAVTERLALSTSDLSKLSPNLKIVKQKVERGLFRSTHEVTVQLGCVPPAALEALHPGANTAPRQPEKAGPPI